MSPVHDDVRKSIPPMIIRNLPGGRKLDAVKYGLVHVDVSIGPVVFQVGVEQ
jgi:hypothetical protein